MINSLTFSKMISPVVTKRRPSPNIFYFFLHFKDWGLDLFFELSFKTSINIDWIYIFLNIIKTIYFFINLLIQISLYSSWILTSFNFKTLFLRKITYYLFWNKLLFVSSIKSIFIFFFLKIAQIFDDFI